mmetsp:Transcript_46963/g.124026  ORF Transcript_46963/g.124026 Transcript_46963/m.124026 type:complete len:228 (-) Transcript_46963:27-710(-)
MTTCMLMNFEGMHRRHEVRTSVEAFLVGVTGSPGHEPHAGRYGWLGAWRHRWWRRGELGRGCGLHQGRGCHEHIGAHVNWGLHLQIHVLGNQTRVLPQELILQGQPCILSKEPSEGHCLARRVNLPARVGIAHASKLELHFAIARGLNTWHLVPIGLATRRILVLLIQCGIRVRAQAQRIHAIWVARVEVVIDELQERPLDDEGVAVRKRRLHSHTNTRNPLAYAEI